MNLSEHLRLQMAWLKSGDEWSQKREGLAFLLITNGIGKCAWRGGAHNIGRGDLLVLSLDGTGKICAANGEGLQLSAFSLSLDQIFPLLGAQEITRVQDVANRLKGVRVFPASSGVAARSHELLAALPERFDLDHRCHLLRIAASVLSEEFKTAGSRVAGFVRMEDHLSQVFDKLSREELLTLGVDDLAAKFACSRRHLNRLFHQYFGTSVAAMRMELRLLKAVSLLRDPAMKIIDVAEQSGFNHLGLFNTCFKRRFGVSPGEWRKGHLSTVGDGELEPETMCPLRLRGLCAWDNAPTGALPRGSSGARACESQPKQAKSGPVHSGTGILGLTEPMPHSMAGAQGPQKAYVRICAQA